MPTIFRGEETSTPDALNCHLVEHQDSLILITPASICGEEKPGQKAQLCCFVLKKAELLEKPHQTKLVGALAPGKVLDRFNSFEEAVQGGIEYAKLCFHGRV